MIESTHAVSAPYRLMRAAEAMTNVKAISMAMIAGMSTFLCFGLAAWAMSGNRIVGAMLMLVAFAVALIGYSALGILLMRSSQGRAVTLGEAFFDALFTAHRLIVVGILLVLIVAAFFIAAVIILLLCRLPGIGVPLYGLAFPVMSVVTGIAIAGLLYVGVPLAAPAIWEGNTSMQAIARLTVIARKRLMMVITNVVVLTVMLVFLSSVMYIILLSGYTTVLGLSSAVGIHPFGGVADLMQIFSSVQRGGEMMGGYRQFGAEGGASYMGAFGFGTGLLFAVGGVLPLITMINGSCLIYLQAKEGLDFSEAEKQVEEKIEEARRRAQEVRDRAAERAAEARSATIPPQAAVRSCVNCRAPLGADDAFCGECGTKNPL